MDESSIQVYAGFWRRVAASIIDFVIIRLAWGIIVFIIILFLDKETIDQLGKFFTKGNDNAIGGLASWIYFAVMESSRYQGTIGKMALRIKVVDLSGNQISFGKASGRWWGKIISTVILGIGFIMAAFTLKKQGLHDIMAGCLVIRRSEKSINMSLPNQLH
jgi:uncharacterized RDD family membrane protein YckC